MKSKEREGDNDGGRRENLCKTIIERDLILTSNALKRLTAGLRPGPLEEHERSPRPYASVPKTLLMDISLKLTGRYHIDALQKGEVTGKIVLNRHRERLNFHLKMH